MSDRVWPQFWSRIIKIMHVEEQEIRDAREILVSLGYDNVAAISKLTKAHSIASLELEYKKRKETANLDARFCFGSGTIGEIAKAATKCVRGVNDLTAQDKVAIQNAILESCKKIHSGITSTSLLIELDDVPTCEVICPLCGDKISLSYYTRSSSSREKTPAVCFKHFNFERHLSIKHNGSVQKNDSQASTAETDSLNQMVTEKDSQLKILRNKNIELEQKLAENDVPHNSRALEFAEKEAQSLKASLAEKEIVIGGLRGEISSLTTLIARKKRTATEKLERLALLCQERLTNQEADQKRIIEMKDLEIRSLKESSTEMDVNFTKLRDEISSLICYQFEDKISARDGTILDLKERLTKKDMEHMCAIEVIESEVKLLKKSLAEKESGIAALRVEVSSVNACKLDANMKWDEEKQSLLEKINAKDGTIHSLEQRLIKKDMERNCAMGVDNVVARSSKISDSPKLSCFEKSMDLCKVDVFCDNAVVEATQSKIEPLKTLMIAKEKVLTNSHAANVETLNKSNSLELEATNVSVADAMELDFNALKGLIAQKNYDLSQALAAIEKLRFELASQTQKNDSTEMQASTSSRETECLVSNLKDEISYLRKLIHKLHRDVAVNLCSYKRIQSNDAIEIGEHCITLKTQSGIKKSYSFERFYNGEVGNNKLDTLEPILSTFLLGKSVCITMHGETASGKSFTMFGDSSSVLQTTFNYLQNRTETGDLFFSAIELYNNQCTDILCSDISKLSVDCTGKTIETNAQKKPISTFSELESLIGVVKCKRLTKATNQNGNCSK